MQKECAHCGASFVQVGRGRPRQWCFVCLPALGQTPDGVYSRQSVSLNAFKVTGIHAACCEPIDRPFTRAVRKVSDLPNPPLPLCVACGTRPVTVRSAKTCGESKCRRKRRTETSVAWKRAARRSGVLLRRERNWKWAVVEFLIERDGRFCPLCGLSIDPHEVDTRLKPSIDHIAPVSRGGRDEIGNLQVVHFACNAAKGNREAA